jgi:beta-glucosidase
MASVVSESIRQFAAGDRARPGLARTWFGTYGFASTLCLTVVLGAALRLFALDPDGRVVARLLTRPHLPVDPAGDQAASKGRAQQEMIDAQTGVAGERIPEIFPEGVDPLARVQCLQRVGARYWKSVRFGPAHVASKSARSIASYRSARRWELLALVCACMTAGPLAANADNRSAPWMNRALSFERRVELVLRRMTIDEKLQLVRGSLKPPHSREMAGYVPGVPRLGIPPLFEINGGIGVADPYEEAPAWEATPLPAEIAIAATWNPSLAYQGGAMVGTEARRRGFNVLLGGAVNLARDPHNGRNFEYAGEDPLLAGAIVGEMIRGIQDQHIISTLKHFAVANQETGRAVLDARIGAPAMRESELLAFEIAMERGDPGSIMCAYNRVNGVYACENDYLLSAVLKRDWGFRGWVMSDWGAVHSTVKAAMAGLDQESAAEMDSRAYFGEPLKRAVITGAMRLSRLHDMARRIVRSLFAKGVIDAPPDPMPIDAEADAAVSRHIIEEGIVLLRNRSHQLPLSHNIRRIAVIGGHADAGVLSGGGSSQVIPFGGPAVSIPWRNEDPLMLYKQVVYDPSPPLGAIAAQAPQAAIDYADGHDPAEAARIAIGADVAIVFVVKWQTEGSDTRSLDLPDGQDQLVAAVAAANPNTIVVLETGNPVLMPWLDQVQAVVEAWYPGARGGDAVAAVLFGEVNPSGRLPITFPKNEDQLSKHQTAGDGGPLPGGFSVA